MGEGAEGLPGGCQGGAEGLGFLEGGAEGLVYLGGGSKGVTRGVTIGGGV